MNVYFYSVESENFEKKGKIEAENLKKAKEMINKMLEDFAIKSFKYIVKIIR